jgi:hypothetical protein
VVLDIPEKKSKKFSEKAVGIEIRKLQQLESRILKYIDQDLDSVASSGQLPY